MHRKTRILTVALAASSLGLATLLGGAAQASAPTMTVTTVISGLNNPRGLAVDTAGHLYVAQAGAYQGDFSSTSSGTSTTGSVSKYSGGQLLWTTQFTSIYDTEHGPEVLGPGGLSTIGNSCGRAAGDEVRPPANGCDVLMIMNESQDATGLTQLGNLYRLNGSTGQASVVSNVGHQMYVWTGDNATQPWAPTYAPGVPQFPDSNPYAVLVARVPARGHEDAGRARTFVADAGANTVSEVMPDGTTRIIAYLPNTPVSDAIPTCITQGPDGALYVGTLHLFDNTIASGSSVVYRVDPNYTGDPVTGGSSVWATGLTTVTSCTFDRAGSFWATEMFYQGGSPVQLSPTAPPSGDIARIRFAHPSTVTHFGWSPTGTEFPVPGGIAVARGGGLYVSVGSNLPIPQGKVLKVSFGS